MAVIRKYSTVAVQSIAPPPWETGSVWEALKEKLNGRKDGLMIIHKQSGKRYMVEQIESQPLVGTKVFIRNKEGAAWWSVFTERENQQYEPLWR